MCEVWTSCLHHPLYTQVYRHPYQKRFTLKFIISLGNGVEEVIVDPIGMMEVNNRTGFMIQGEWVCIHNLLKSCHGLSILLLHYWWKPSMCGWCECLPQTESNSSDHTGMKNGYIPPGSEDSAGIEFQVLLSNIKPENDFQGFCLSFTKLPETWVVSFQGSSNDQFILLWPYSILHCE